MTKTLDPWLVQKKDLELNFIWLGKTNKMNYTAYISGVENSDEFYL